MRGWFNFVAWLVVLMGLWLWAIHSFVLEAWTVPGDDPMLAASMEPTLSAGDVVLVWRGATFARGNLLRCPDPQAPGRYVIARAMGAPGDHLEILDEMVSLDGVRLPSPHSCEQPEYAILDPRRQEKVNLRCSVEDYGDRTFSALMAKDHPEAPTQARVEVGKWFFVSDNRHIHVDSRDYGQLDPAGCRHVVFRLFGQGGAADEKKRLTLVW